MSDRVFQLSLTSLSIVAVLWMIAGSILGVLGIFWVILIGLVVWIVIGAILIHYWGKDYMDRG